MCFCFPAQAVSVIGRDICPCIRRYIITNCLCYGGMLLLECVLHAGCDFQC